MENIIALDNIIAAGIGLISGVIGSLIAPWIHWGIDKRKSRRQARYALMIASKDFVMSKQFGVIQYAKREHYHQLRNEFSKVAVLKFDEALIKAKRAEDVSENRELTRQLVLKEISRIEKKWFLI